ncbi:hypothetical protein GCM10025868_18350 [Angustibacter aerolatus]|uniref:K(+)-insensitive pyrophosphate-energized proton pump n=1 Tax=Angustibacter aerolatus TaxID=1162965 RepID=A0ABQ6JH85_9ACTN|nr:hypothetical protein GCM10025868_18350 [Angustibacter aerolatus]
MPGLFQAAEGPTVAGADLTYVIVVGLIALVALGVAFTFRKQVLSASEGTPSMIEIGRAVQEGASAYLGRQFRTLIPFVVVVLLLLLALPADTTSIRIGRSAFFVLGALFSASIGYLGMSLAVRANVRVADAARAGDRDGGMRIAIRTGGTVGMATVGLGLFGAALVVVIYRGDAPKVLEGFGFGAALLAMFMRVGGGIFTKAADVGADLVGKVEQNIPEDDPRNAATIADNVGDNVGDCAGMAADLFESYAVTLVAALILGRAAFGDYGLVFPLIVPALGAITAVLGVFVIRPRVGESGLTAINRGFYISAVISFVLCAIAAFVYLPSSFAEPDQRQHRRPDARRQPALGGHRRRPARHRAGRHHPVAHRVLHRHRGPPGPRRRPHLADRRGHGGAVRHRRGPRVGRLHRGHHRRRRLPGVRAGRLDGDPVAVPHRAGRLRPAHHRRRHRRDGHLRPGQRQRPGHRRDVGRRRRAGRADPHRGSTRWATRRRPSPRASRSPRRCWRRPRCSARTPTPPARPSPTAGSTRRA